ncbi:MAG: hypothetical protein ACRDG3_03225 [Tepidiformaceae bacterium]
MVVTLRCRSNYVLKMAPLSDADLTEQSQEHLAYEVRMFLAAVFMPLELPEGDGDRSWFIRNARSEAAVLHGRNLIDFLYPRGSSRQDDLRADHFYADPSVCRAETIPPELENLRARADKEIAHLTIKRLPGSPPEKAYDEAAFESLLARLRDFVRAADPSKLHPSVNRLLVREPT